MYGQYSHKIHCAEYGGCKYNQQNTDPVSSNRQRIYIYINYTYMIQNIYIYKHNTLVIQMHNCTTNYFNIKSVYIAMFILEYCLCLIVYVEKLLLCL